MDNKLKRKKNGEHKKINENAPKRMKTRSRSKKVRQKPEDKNISDYLLQEMTGKEFKRRFPNLSKNLVKLTNKSECHNGFQFKTGLNKDTVLFNPTSECREGGIYFTDIENLAEWIEYGKKVMKYYRNVVLPDHCRVYVEEKKFKAD